MESNWAENYRKYIKFQCEVLPYAYEFGGTKFSKNWFPSFKEFEESLSTNKDFLKYFAAEEYNSRQKRDNFHNTLNYCFRPDINWVKVYYSLFRGVKHNIRFEFKDKKNYREKQEFMNNYKRA